MLKSRRTLLVPLAAVLVAAAGCGSGTSDDPGQAPADRASAVHHDKLPQQFKDSGVIRFAGDSHPPYRIVGGDGKTVTGVDQDLQRALGAVLGVRTEITIVPGLPAALSGMLSGRYDGFNGPVKDTAEREEKFDAIVWMVTRTAYLIPESGPRDVKASSDLCGKRVAAVDGSIVQDQLTRLARWCADKGKPAVQFVGFADTNGTILAAKSGRVDAAGMTESAALDAMAAEKGKFTYVTQTDEQGAGVDQLAMLVPKSSGLGPVMLEAFKEIFANGQYAKIMKQYGLENVAVDQPKLNTAAQR
ncbi:transporter substrate-binding domain-containing protein [Kibdelosporangium persicum]|uniref:Periplasmic component of amino acid ABC-type transporter/signal transduction system n=1 Tax=Kibdelosporangium persicum TaxID=2698649 RepID=A0ABX2F9A2_9PSEU|nr:transporter substrate-binding domain-containing protein [Kibdelosporangium persicum]NRN67941.1 Periplasmic component of amino acid ABC-type transporter/signal transduction system [Kibdelosporangium persicum]